MLLPYDDFYRKFFETRGVAEAEGRAWLDTMVAMMDPFVIDGIEGKKLGTEGGFSSDIEPVSINWDQPTKSTFNSAARDDAAGKKET